MNFNLYNIFYISLLLILTYTVLVNLIYLNSKYYKTTGINRRDLKKHKYIYFEYSIFKKLLKIKGENYILTNVYLPKYNGKHTECDIIFIHNSGVYVLEVKSINGIIYGDSEVKYWTASYNNKDFQFFNPIKQNETHIRYIIKNIIFNFDRLYKSIIVFNNSALLKNLSEKGTNVHVIISKNLKKTIYKISRQDKGVINKYMMKEIYERLLPYCKASYKIKRAHKKHIKKIIRKYG